MMGSQADSDSQQPSRELQLPAPSPDIPADDACPVAEIDLAISGMSCAACVARVEKKLNKLPGVQAVVNLATEKAHVQLSTEAGDIGAAELIETVEKAGYGAALLGAVDADGARLASGESSSCVAVDNAASASEPGVAVNLGVPSVAVNSALPAPAPAANARASAPAKAANTPAKSIAPTSARAPAPNPAQAHARRIRDLWRRFWLSLAMSVPIVSMSMIPPLQFPYWQWIVGVAALVVAGYCAWPFHKAALRAARHGSSTMDTLVSLGVAASMGWSIWAVLLGGAGGADYRMAMSGIHKIAGTAADASMRAGDAAHMGVADSLAAVAGHAPHVYFESAAMIVTFLLLGRFLEARSRRSAGDALRELLELGADEAYLVRRAGVSDMGGSGAAEGNAIIPAAELRVGDIFRVRPGEKIATDGVIVKGASAINAALVTGESAPIEVSVGDAVTGATINTYGTIDVRASRIGEQTTLAQMGRLLSQAQSGKAPVQRLADKIAGIFVPVVLGIAAVDLIGRLALAGLSGGVDAVSIAVEPALSSAIAVLVVACPCALGLATPTALLVGSGAASRHGIFLRGPEVLEKAHRVSVALLDKTGTLTQGAMRVGELHVPEPANGHGHVNGTCTDEGNAREQELLSVAAAVESFSEHPIAEAIVAASELQPGHASGAVVSDFRAIPGKGVQAHLEGWGLVSAGKEVWLEESGFEIPQDVSGAARRFSASGASAVIVGVENSVRHDSGKLDSEKLDSGKRVLGVIAVSDTIRPESPAAIAQLKKMGIEPILISGDSQAVAEAVGAQLGMKARGEILPEGKVQAVRDLQARGENVLMVGDGVNDAAALAAADLSIAMGAGTDVAKAAADITVINSDPLLIPTSLQISARTLRIVKQNLAWAFGYNLIAIPLAFAGIVLPGLAAAAMASSSVIVVTNSLRLKNL